MELKLLGIEQSILNKIKLNQVFLGICIFASIGVVIWNIDYSIWAMYLTLIGALNLPHINKCKSDLADYKKGVLKSTIGTILDVLTETIEGETKWTVFINSEDDKTPKEYSLSSNPNIKENGEHILSAETLVIGSTLEIFYTKEIEQPVKLIIISQS